MMPSDQGHPRRLQRLPRTELPPETDPVHKKTADEDPKEGGDRKKKTKKQNKEKKKKTEKDENKEDELNRQNEQTEQTQFDNDHTEVSKF